MIRNCECLIVAVFKYIISLGRALRPCLGPSKVHFERVFFKENNTVFFLLLFRRFFYAPDLSIEKVVKLLIPTNRFSR